MQVTRKYDDLHVYANACNEAKMASKQICLSNDDDGVAKWLEERFFRQKP